MNFDLDAFLPYRLSVAADQISREFARHYAEKAGLSIAEWRIMAHLANESPVSVRDLTQKVNLEKSAVSRAVARLEARDLVKRAAHGGDQRLLALSLTPAGQGMMADLIPMADRFNNDLKSRLGPEADHLIALLARLTG